jgi:RNA polymerase sigma factor (sigma-70 family)
MADRVQRSVNGVIGRLIRVGTAAGLSDAQLLERFATRHGEAAECAFAALLERHGPMVLRVCHSVLGDPHDAQDALQATFLILVRKAGAVRRRESLAGWLYGVALRVAAHSRSTAARRRAVEFAAGSIRARCFAPPPEDRHLELWDEVDRLPERFRLAVVLCYLEGLTHEQAAARLEWPVGTVRSRLARARQRLRGRLTKRGLAPSAAVLAALGSRSDASSLPLSLVEPTGKAAMLIAARDAAEAGLVSTSAAALTEGVLRTMFFAKLKSAALALLTAGTIAAGAGVYGYQAPAPPRRPPPPAVRKNHSAPKPRGTSSRAQRDPYRNAASRTDPPRTQSESLPSLEPRASCRNRVNWGARRTPRHASACWRASGAHRCAAPTASRASTPRRPSGTNPFRNHRCHPLRRTPSAPMRYREHRG